MNAKATAIPNQNYVKNQDQEIEESIIEEDIQTGQNQVETGPVTPLISSQTKGKAKMNLFKMKPPIPSKGISMMNIDEPSEKSNVDETFDEMYSNHQAKKNIR